MILANVIFGPRKKGEIDQLEDAVERYLGALLQAGQLCGDYFLAWTKGLLNAHVLLAGRGASELRYHSKWGKQELKRVTQFFGRKPLWRMLDDESRKAPSSWKGTPFLYLFTHAFDKASPVCRGDKKTPVPLFMLPLSFEQKSGLYSWQNDYFHYDRIWLSCGFLELAVYRQLADPSSELAKCGRDLCRGIETATRVPT